MMAGENYPFDMQVGIKRLKADSWLYKAHP